MQLFFSWVSVYVWVSCGQCKKVIFAKNLIFRSIVSRLLWRRHFPLGVQQLLWGTYRGEGGAFFSDYITFHPYHYIDILPHRKLLTFPKIDED